MDEQVRIESKEEVSTYIARLKYALDQNAEIKVQMERQVDYQRELRYTNKFTIADLFPDEKPTDAMRRELKTLTVENYLRTVKDIHFPNKKEMREFGKVYNGKDDVYIKIRVELLGNTGTTTFVMSFHYAERPLSEEHFPYR